MLARRYLTRVALCMPVGKSVEEVLGKDLYDVCAQRLAANGDDPTRMDTHMYLPADAVCDCCESHFPGILADYVRSLLQCVRSDAFERARLARPAQKRFVIRFPDVTGRHRSASPTTSEISAEMVYREAIHALARQ